MKTLIIIPAYNEAKNLLPLLKLIRNTCPQHDAVVINDCSTDNTLAICKQHGVHVIDLPVNLGIGGAVQSGYRYAQYRHYDAAVQVDGDGQHNPEFINMLLSELEDGANICIGSRFISGEGFQSSGIRRAAINFFSRLIRFLTGLRITDPTSGFRACDRLAISLFASDYPKDYPEPESIVNAARNKLHIREIPVIMNERKEGKSSITFIKSLYYMIKVSLAVVIASLYSTTKMEVDE